MVIRYHQQRVLVLAPHADDETLGCGGIIQKFRAAGSPVRVVVASFILGNCERFSLREQRYMSYSGEQRYAEMQLAMGVLGVTDYHILHLELADEATYHSKLDNHPRVELTTLVEAHLLSFQPTILLIPSVTKHQDHSRLHEAALAAARPYFWNGSICVYETDGELDFHPNFYVPLLAAELSTKCEALEAYQTQLAEPPHPVSVQSVQVKAQYRGQNIQEAYAEAFQMLRLRG